MTIENRKGTLRAALDKKYLSCYIEMNTNYWEWKGEYHGFWSITGRRCRQPDGKY